MIRKESKSELKRIRTRVHERWGERLRERNIKLLKHIFCIIVFLSLSQKCCCRSLRTPDSILSSHQKSIRSTWLCQSQLYFLVFLCHLLFLLPAVKMKQNTCKIARKCMRIKRPQIVCNWGWELTTLTQIPQSAGGYEKLLPPSLPSLHVQSPLPEENSGSRLYQTPCVSE